MVERLWCCSYVTAAFPLHVLHGSKDQNCIDSFFGIHMHWQRSSIGLLQCVSPILPACCNPKWTWCRRIPVLGGPKNDKFSIVRVLTGTDPMVKIWSCRTKNPLNRQSNFGLYGQKDSNNRCKSNAPTSAFTIVLYQCCTRPIGCASIVTFWSPIKTQNYTHVFFCCHMIPTTAYMKFIQKNWLTDRHLSQNCLF